MSPDGGGEPDGDLAAAIDSAFGSFSDFQAKFKDAGVNQFGSGWAWLVHDGSGLAVVSTCQPGQPAHRRQDAPARRGRLGARLLPEVPEQAPGLHRRVVERRTGRRWPRALAPPGAPPAGPSVGFGQPRQAGSRRGRRAVRGPGVLSTNASCERLLESASRGGTLCLGLAMSDWIGHAEQTLARGGLPLSAPRSAVVRPSRPRLQVTAKEIADLLHQRGEEVGVAASPGRSSCSTARLTRRVDVAEGVARYELIDPSGEHHHHLVCDTAARCRRSRI